MGCDHVMLSSQEHNRKRDFSPCILLYSFLKNVALSISSDLTVPEAEILIYNLPCMAKKKKVSLIKVGTSY